MDSDHNIDIRPNYIGELQENFRNLKFKCLEKVNNMFVTNEKNLSYGNDVRIFTETQVKRTLSNMIIPFMSKSVKKKFSYFSQEEDPNMIYQPDSPSSLQCEEKYAIQNVGHATQLIQIPGFTILTDPIFNDMNWLLYPAKTLSHPSIENLPRVDVILISHNHQDHIDKTSLQNLLEQQKINNWPCPQIFVPIGDKKLIQSFGFKDVIEVDWFTKISVTNNGGDTVNFVSIPADHRSGRKGLDHHQSLVMGWIINPESQDVVFKFSGDSRPLTDENQKAVDAVLWHEIKNKIANRDKEDSDISLPDIVCLEPSGPNYTRSDMDVTHQSTSYSALLKLTQAKNLSEISQKNFNDCLWKFKTVMMHHNKFELGPDRFNEGLFIFKKLLLYLDLDEGELNKEFLRQRAKLNLNLDRKRLKECMPLTARPLIYSLSTSSSLIVHAKDFIISDIKDVYKAVEGMDKSQMREYLLKNTVFLKIGERCNRSQLENYKFDEGSVSKYKKKPVTL